ncbi:MAG: copper-binding protein, partial [Phycisphaerales bacterium]|nr:copper-binding protein [Phycisphaerales bacterium]
MSRNTCLAAALSLLVIAVPGCGEEPKSNAPDLSIYEEGSHTYRVRGVILQLPDAGPPPAELRIRHEHIPGFIGVTGEIHRNRDGVSGMKSMAMDFPDIAGDVALGEFAPGDKVVFEFKVKWLESPSGDKSPRWLVSAIEPLPADAEISFENKVGQPHPPDPTSHHSPTAFTPNRTPDEDGVNKGRRMLGSGPKKPGTRQLSRAPSLVGVRLVARDRFLIPRASRDTSRGGCRFLSVRPEEPAPSAR